MVTSHAGIAGITIEWVTSQARIAGNEEVDWTAKSVTSNSFIPDSVIMKKSFLSNSVSKVEAIIRFYLSSNCHCRLNFQLKKNGFHSTELCSQCLTVEDVAHFLLNCSKCKAERNWKKFKCH